MTIAPGLVSGQCEFNNRPWRLAKSLVTLANQVDEIAPHRSKTKGPDGTHGDAAHHQRTSDHNENSSAGAVCALDLSHDPAGGFDAHAFAETLRQNKDQRIKYVISNQRIFYGPRSPSHGGDPSSLWKWSSADDHENHIHISVGDPRYYDETELWNITVAPQPPDAELPMLQRGSTGADVQTVQKIIFVDGIFGPTTEKGVKDFQSAHGLAADGIVGRMTWAALLGTSGGVPTGDWQTNITATVFGGASDPNNSAYDGHRITDTELGASVPARVEGNRLVDIRDPATGKVVQATIVDIGPWMVDDPYWQTGTRPIAEDMTQPLPRGPNKGRRSNGAGFDMTPGTVRALGWNPDTGRWKIDWKFHTTDEAAQPLRKAVDSGMFSNFPGQSVDATREATMNGSQPAPKGITIPLGVNWKTNIGAIIAVVNAAATAWLAYQSGSLTPEMISTLVTALGLAWVGFSAKDSNVTGGTKQQ